MKRKKAIEVAATPSILRLQRWHKERAMPIAFLGSTVVIPKAALDLWLMQGQPQLRPVAPPGETEQTG